VYLFNVDDLQAIADAHLRERQAEAERCNQIIREKARQLSEGMAAPRPERAQSISVPNLSS
jgi:glutamyl-tRNA reductase